LRVRILRCYLLDFRNESLVKVHLPLVRGSQIAEGTVSVLDRSADLNHGMDVYFAVEAMTGRYGLKLTVLPLSVSWTRISR